jgi:hypothetical protein
VKIWKCSDGRFYQHVYIFLLVNPYHYKKYPQNLFTYITKYMMHVGSHAIWTQLYYNTPPVN